jgi:hypothetical protein
VHDTLATDCEVNVVGRVRTVSMSKAIGDKHLPLATFKRMGAEQRVSLIEKHARSCSFKLARVIRLQFVGEDRGQQLRFAFNDPYNAAVWRGMLRQYGCASELIELTVQRTKELLRDGAR